MAAWPALMVVDEAQKSPITGRGTKLAVMVWLAATSPRSSGLAAVAVKPPVPVQPVNP